jgi:hypothetical protein
VVTLFHQSALLQEHHRWALLQELRNRE